MATLTRPTFLVLGASGNLGRHLYRSLGPARAVATFHATPVPGAVHFDATRMRLSDTLLSGAHGFRAAFVLFGRTAIDACARDPQASAQLNVDSTIHVIDELIAAGVKPVFASSDAVFDGTRGNWTEDDPANPILTYGRQKAQVERYLMAQSSPWVITRLSKLMGDGAETDPLAQWLRQIENGQEIRCATDQRFSPLDIVAAADILLALAQTNASGLYHVGGPQAMTRMELFETLLAAIRRYRSVVPKVIACSIRDFAFLEPRPLDCSMSSAKVYRALENRPRDMEAVCLELARKNLQ